MRDLLKGTEILIGLELENVAIEKGTKFVDMHQGYAVILEEVQEAEEELDRVKQKLKLVWGATRRDEYPEESIQMLKHYAKLLACESIQIAAMAQKLMNSFKE